MMVLNEDRHLFDLKKSTFSAKNKISKQQNESLELEELIKKNSQPKQSWFKKSKKDKKWFKKGLNSTKVFWHTQFIRNFSKIFVFWEIAQFSDKIRSVVHSSRFLTVVPKISQLLGKLISYSNFCKTLQKFIKIIIKNKFKHICIYWWNINNDKIGWHKWQHSWVQHKSRRFGRSQKASSSKNEGFFD